MYGSENDMQIYEMFVFPITRSVDDDSQIRSFCEYDTDCQNHLLLSAMIHDQDFTFFDDIKELGIVKVLENSVNETISTIQSVDEGEFPVAVTTACVNDPQAFGFTLYMQYYNNYVAVIQHLKSIFDSADYRNVNYCDFNLSEAGDGIVLRLLKGIAL